MASIRYPKLLAEYNAYMARWKGSKKPVLPYTAPCCGAQLETPVPRDVRETWDSLCTCAHCGGTYMKIATSKAVTLRSAEVL